MFAESLLTAHSCAVFWLILRGFFRADQGFEDMDETFLRNVSRLGNKFKGTELGGAHTGLAGEDEEEEVRDYPNCCRVTERMPYRAS